MSEYTKKNVLFCLHYSSMNNGAVRSLVDVVEYLIINNEINAYIVYLDKKGDAINYLEELGAKAIHLPFYRNDFKIDDSKKNRILGCTKYIIKRILAPVFFYKAYMFARKEKIDVVYSNTVVIDYGIKLSKVLKVPHIWHVREFGKEDHNLSFFFGEKKLYQLMNKSNTVVYISNSIYKKYSKEIQVPKQYVVYNDISDKFINRKKEFNLSKICPLNVLVIGTIQEGKRQLDVIKAVEQLNKEQIKVILHIAGAKLGNYYQSLLNYINSNDLNDSVVFDGFIQDVNKLRNSMDVGVVSSKMEAFGRVTIEGMLSELAMIGANTAGTAELINSGENGLLYEFDDIDCLTNCLNRLYEDRNYMVTIAQNGFNDALQKYTNHNAAKKIGDIILNIK